MDSARSGQEDIGDLQAISINTLGLVNGIRTQGPVGHIKKYTTLIIFKTSASPLPTIL